MSMPYLHATETKLMLQVKDDLSRHEGFREYAYPDPLSKLYAKLKDKSLWGTCPAKELIPDFEEADGMPWTVGFGFTNGVTSESRMPRIQAERKLEELILEMKNALGTALPWFVKEASFVTQTVMINMAFNLGLAGLLKFRNTLRYIKEKNYTQAAANMKKSLWYGQVKDRAKELTSRVATQTIEPQHRAKERIV